MLVAYDGLEWRIPFCLCLKLFMAESVCVASGEKSYKASEIRWCNSGVQRKVEKCKCDTVMQQLGKLELCLNVMSLVDDIVKLSRLGIPCFY